MAYIALVPHSVDVYVESAFENLEQINPTTWVADLVYSEQAVAVFPSRGVARIATKTVEVGLIDTIPCVRTEYGEAVGIPSEVAEEDILIVSLPMQSMMKASGHPLANRAVAPYKVVRDRADTSKVLGCMGFTF